ncbi:MAG: hypothetical protein GY855_02700, partial [candidate division Zixibacteria bacterium]|nr:hypothetical protein [candidate division Zixibacteria bacterium]
QDDYGEYVIADSVRYWAESTYQRNPDEFTDRMELKFNAEVVYDGLLYMAIISEDDWEFTISADTIGIDGTGEFIFDFSDSIGSISYDQEFDGIKFLENASHPHTGEMSVNMDVTAYNEETGQMDSATFTLEVTFYEEYMHIYMSDGTYYWEWDEYYDQG